MRGRIEHSRLPVRANYGRKKSLLADDTVAAKQNVLKSQLPLLIVAATALLFVFVYFIYRGFVHSKCDSIFEQTADRARGKLEFIEIKGEIALGREKIQELTEASQKVALHLKTCCIAQQAGALSPERFEACLSGAKDYEKQIVQVAANIKEANTAKEQKNPELVKQKAEAATEGVTKVATTERTLAKAIEFKATTKEAKAADEQKEPEFAKPKTEAAKGTPTYVAPIEETPAKRANAFLTSGFIENAEQEVNDTLSWANVEEMDRTIVGEIGLAADTDFFKFQYRDEKNRRDVVLVYLENRSTTLRPSLTLYNEDKSRARDRITANTKGADLEFTFAAEPEKSYYVEVGSDYGWQTAGKYRLSIVRKKAYDQYEPNDDVFTATRIQIGADIRANISDGRDVDFYRFSGRRDSNVLSGTRGKNLRIMMTAPRTRQLLIRVFEADKSPSGKWVAGPDAFVPLAAESNKEYCIEVAAVDDETSRSYVLSVR